jgi:hypothetical protein
VITPSRRLQMTGSTQSVREAERCGRTDRTGSSMALKNKELFLFLSATCSRVSETLPMMGARITFSSVNQVSSVNHFVLV